MTFNSSANFFFLSSITVALAASINDKKEKIERKDGGYISIVIHIIQLIVNKIVGMRERM